MIAPCDPRHCGIGGHLTGGTSPLAPPAAVNRKQEVLPVLTSCLLTGSHTFAALMEHCDVVLQSIVGGWGGLSRKQISIVQSWGREVALRPVSLVSLASRKPPPLVPSVSLSSQHTADTNTQLMTSVVLRWFLSRAAPPAGCRWNCASVLVFCGLFSFYRDITAAESVGGVGCSDSARQQRQHSRLICFCSLLSRHQLTGVH